MTGATKLVMASAQHTGPIARLLTPKQAAECLGIPEGTLAQWRSQRRGPAFIKMEGRLVRYRASDLESYVSARIVETVANGDA
ncbi:MAG: helix-turn-helix transcriptional regulator [Candidatus Acidiferrales bacterium]